MNKGTKEQKNNGTKEQRNRERKEQRNKGTKEQRNKVTKEQRKNGTTEQRNKGTKEQRNKETKSSSNWVRHNQVSWSSFSMEFLYCRPGISIALTTNGGVNIWGSWVKCKLNFTVVWSNIMFSCNFALLSRHFW